MPVTLRAWLTKHWEWPLALLLGVGALRLFTDYGIGWDANVHATYGELVLDYFLGGLQHPEQTELADLHFYGYLFDLPSAAIHRFLHVEMHAFRGLLSAWWAIATVPAVAALARRLGSERQAVFAVAGLLLTPQFFGQAFINQKDIPLAAAVCWAMVAILRLVEDDKASWGRVLVAAGAIGAVLSVRVGALFIVVFLGAAILLRSLQRGMASGWRNVPGPSHILKLVPRVMAGGVIVWLAVIAGWPYAHENPWLNPWKAVQVALNFPNVYGVLFQGQLIDSNRLPAGYLPTYLALGYQPAMLGLILVGAVTALGTLARGWQRPPALALGLVLFWIGFPLLYVMLRRPPLYDGMRHFLFVLPPLALLAGMGANSLWGWLRPRIGGLATGILVGGIGISAGWPLVQWHPYQYAYANALAGDPAVRHRQFENDYWKTSYKAAAAWLNEQQQLSPRPLTVVVAASDMSSTCLVYYLDPQIKWLMTTDNLESQRLPAEIDYYVGSTRYRWDENFDLTPVVWEERRGGVLFCVIRSDRHALAHHSE